MRMQHCKKRKRKSLITMAALAMSSKTAVKIGQHVASFDTDSEIIGVDNRCSACISHEAADFITPLQSTKRTIKGFGGARTTHVMTGTLLWKWADDSGKIHGFKIPNSYYALEGACRLLSPQHWAKTQKDSDPNGTGEFTSNKTCKLFWQGREHCLTIPLTTATNVANIHMAPGYEKYSMYCKTAEIIDNAKADKNILTANIAEVEPQNKHNKPVMKVGSDTKLWTPDPNYPIRSDFSLNGPDNISLDFQTRKQSSSEVMNKTSQDMLKLHHRLGHIPFRKIQMLAKEGAIPKGFATCEIPVCSSCLYAKMAKRPWRGKQSKSNPPLTKLFQPGEVVAVDQLVSPTQGLVAQMT